MFREYKYLGRFGGLEQYQLIDTDFTCTFSVHTVSPCPWTPFMVALAAIYRGRGMNVGQNLFRCLLSVQHSHGPPKQILKQLEQWQMDEEWSVVYYDIEKYLILV